MGLGLAAALIVAAGPPSANPLTQGAQANGEAAPGADEALPPAADDFFDGDQSAGTQQGGQDRGSPGGGSPNPAPGGSAGTASPPGAIAEGGATLAPSQEPEQQEQDSGSAPDSGSGQDSDGSGDNGDTGGGQSDSSSGGSAPSTMAQQVVAIANEERADAGCAPLRVDRRLTAASEAHSRDMAERDYMAHETPEGEGPAERAEDAGYDAWSGENVAAGYTSPESVMEGWMNSPGHRANILDCGNTEVGVGETDTKWAQNFGSE
ncbi:CAP domain-containing protein [Streptomonospora litoralis]|uniref:CAP domain-containing protein n=1 Tax=Streptomonospora litoralis TaxID=2498135 RepID=UPI001F62109F|nr:CAP domain-containing protein [Streptomonospora litoralis]